MKLHLNDIILEPVITEKILKTTGETAKYAFRVHPASNKKQIKSAIEKVFNVHVTKVNVMNVGGKWKRVRHQAGQTPDWKKAILTLKKGEKIDVTA
ncbi:MAG: 50S ribosomal protein L23 [Candidatus Omnitrophica bacterium]|nr:50S ribosomal protein L23 [Candidatus Omnitrophota bacterium]